MSGKPNFNKLKKKATLTGRYEKQLERLKAGGVDTSCVEAAVNGTMKKLAASAATSMVIYGDPQSGKTEMMICLTAKLLDSGHHIIIHLLNDSVDLLTQNLKRFKKSGLAPVAQISSEILPKVPKAKKSSAPKIAIPSELVLICKKNTKDLQVLTNWLQDAKNVVVIDDEADYATPNSKVNKGTKSKINDWVAQLKGAKGRYIGVTATPARLDLNNTFGNETDKWVKFPPHSQYTGQDTFFPLDPKDIKFRLVQLQQGASQKEARNALVRFLVTVARRNTVSSERYYTMLVHTSGKRDDHEIDRATIENAVTILRDITNPEFETLAGEVYSTAEALYPDSDPQALAEYVVEIASKTALIVLNSKHSRQASMGNATEPVSPFTIIIGGNIVSRGVTFPNLLAMFFTRDVKTKLQQDTYIQRARMFGARGDLLSDFELTIPGPLYDDWKKCFIYHKLALATIESNVDVQLGLETKEFQSCRLPASTSRPSLLRKARCHLVCSISRRSWMKL